MLHFQKALQLFKGGAAASCQFCGKRHEATADELKTLIARMSERPN
jgi:redox-regulated HSP33 family molecular chaperone